MSIMGSPWAASRFELDSLQFYGMGSSASTLESNRVQSDEVGDAAAVVHRIAEQRLVTG
ncbi:hypothetical protein [Rhodococcus sp. SORGH_AS_0303]|uniref:hypothetical protein n=1 Tax=Rhodococcus sp. SORGH_AS_0303 TaxID=3041753 RepID=UPI0027878EB6|nr:hypothetical protein [Rhodococcus sp. SORGH_AS_0303]MDQ1203070.1 hypothetical protein [Rhodococcus sp. SORGH_AS_0303]